MRISDWSSDVCSSDLVIKALSAQIDDPEGRPVRDCDIGCQCRVILERRIEQRQAAVDTQPRYGLDPGFQLQALDPGIGRVAGQYRVGCRIDARDLKVVELDIEGGDVEPEPAIKQIELCADLKIIRDPRIEPNGFVDRRSEEHPSELQSLMRISYAV